MSDGLVDFLLPDLTLPGLGTLGDIELTNVTTTTEADGTVVYNATVEDMSLPGGDIHAKVVLANGDGKSCTTDAAGNAHFNIDVIWYMDYPANTQEMPIYVTFNGKQTSLASATSPPTTQQPRILRPAGQHHQCRRTRPRPRPTSSARTAPPPSSSPSDPRIFNPYESGSTWHCGA